MAGQVGNGMNVAVVGAFVHLDCQIYRVCVRWMGIVFWHHWFILTFIFIHFHTPMEPDDALPSRHPLDHVLGLYQLGQLATLRWFILLFRDWYIVYKSTWRTKSITYLMKHTCNLYALDPRLDWAFFILWAQLENYKCQVRKKSSHHGCCKVRAQETNFEARNTILVTEGYTTWLYMIWGFACQDWMIFQTRFSQSQEKNPWNRGR